MLKATLETLFLPPASFLYVALAGLLSGRRHQPIGRTLQWIGLLSLTLCALPVVADSMIASLEWDLPLSAPPDAMPQAIVILGGDVLKSTEPPFARVGRLTLERLRSGAALQRRTGLPILVTGGLVESHPVPVGTLMANSLRDDFRVPVTWVEDASVDTWENAGLSADILKKQGIHSVFVVTHGWHMQRAVMAFRHAGLTVTAAPTALDRAFDPAPSDFLPHVSALLNCFWALHEWIGCAWYALR